MTGFSYENQGAHTYLSYEVKADEALNSMVLGMLTHNKITGLAETRFTQENETRYLKYDVTAKVTVKQFFSGVVNKRRLLGVFSGVANALQSAEEYMIDVGDILLDTEYIFSDVSSYQTVLICLPLERENAEQAVDVGAFFKQLIFNTQFDQSENCDHVAKIINYFNSVQVFSLKDFGVLLNRLKSERSGVAVPAGAERPKNGPAQNGGDGGGQYPGQLPHQPPVREQPVRPRPDIGGQPVIKPPAPPAPVSPKKNPAPMRGQKKAPAGTDAEKKMSALYLLRHYSKENLELYKAQSAAPGKDSGKGKEPRPGKGGAGKKDVVPPKEKKRQPPAEFVVPGEQKNMDGDHPLFRNTDGRGVGVSAPPRTPKPARPQENQERRPYTPQPVQNISGQEPGRQSIGFGDTVIIDEETGDGTIVLGEQTEKEPTVIKPHLIRQSNHEKIMIDKPLFRIGRERDYVDYCISDNRTIGRSHANIISRDGAFYIVDINSRNHTYVNGEMIQSNTEVKIEHGTMINLSSESFEFRLY